MLRPSKCTVPAPKVVFRGVGLAEADYLCRRLWQTAYLRVLSPDIVFRRGGLAEAESWCRRPWQTAYLRFLCAQNGC